MIAVTQFPLCQRSKWPRVLLGRVDVNQFVLLDLLEFPAAFVCVRYVWVFGMSLTLFCDIELFKIMTVH